MRRRLAILAIGLAVPLLSADAAMACSCIPLKPREQLKASDAAFIGRLIEVREVDPPAGGEGISSADAMDYVYRVGRIYKDPRGRLHRGGRVRVRSVRDSASCGLPDQVGELIGLFVQRKNHRWHGNLCLTTSPRRMRRALESASSAGSPGSAGCG
ncbi:MAG TPA: hypothetical protein VJT68_00615 [Thermoleophilaceae bacterium]|nr:hypothetical protein [Thermoleophilaceae bacterium]